MFFDQTASFCRAPRFWLRCRVGAPYAVGMVERPKHPPPARLDPLGDDPARTRAALDKAVRQGERQTDRARQMTRALQAMAEKEDSARALAQAIRGLLRQE